MKHALSDERLKEIALKCWPPSKKDEFEGAWNHTLLPVMREQEQRSSAISQHVYSNPSGGHFQNPNAGAETPWWEGDARTANDFMQSHVDSLKVFAGTLYSKQGEEPRRRREEIEKTKKDTAEKHEADRIAKLKGEFRNGAMQRFRTAGGTTEEFEECFDKLWGEHLQRQAVEKIAAPLPQYVRDF